MQGVVQDVRRLSIINAEEKSRNRGFPLYICSKRKNDRVYCGKELFLMKHMTNTQIDEINRLLTDHREALTAFWDEAFY